MTAVAASATNVRETLGSSILGNYFGGNIHEIMKERLRTTLLTNHFTDVASVAQKVGELGYRPQELRSLGVELFYPVLESVFVSRKERVASTVDANAEILAILQYFWGTLYGTGDETLKRTGWRHVSSVDGSPIPSLLHRAIEMELPGVVDYLLDTVDMDPIITVDIGGGVLINTFAYACQNRDSAILNKLIEKSEGVFSIFANDDVTPAEKTSVKEFIFKKWGGSREVLDTLFENKFEDHFLVMLRTAIKEEDVERYLAAFPVITNTDPAAPITPPEGQWKFRKCPPLLYGMLSPTSRKAVTQRLFEEYYKTLRPEDRPVASDALKPYPVDKEHPVTAFSQKGASCFPDSTFTALLESPVLKEIFYPGQSQTGTIVAEKERKEESAKGAIVTRTRTIIAEPDDKEETAEGAGVTRTGTIIAEPDDEEETAEGAGVTATDDTVTVCASLPSREGSLTNTKEVLRKKYEQIFEMAAVRHARMPSYETLAEAAATLGTSVTPELREQYSITNRIAFNVARGINREGVETAGKETGIGYDDQQFLFENLFKENLLERAGIDALQMVMYLPTSLPEVDVTFGPELCAVFFSVTPIESKEPGHAMSLFRQTDGRWCFVDNNMGVLHTFQEQDWVTSVMLPRIITTIRGQAPVPDDTTGRMKVPKSYGAWDNTNKKLFYIMDPTLESQLMVGQFIAPETKSYPNRVIDAGYTLPMYIPRAAYFILKKAATPIVPAGGAGQGGGARRRVTRKRSGLKKKSGLKDRGTGKHIKGTRRRG